MFFSVSMDWCPAVCFLIFFIIPVFPSIASAEKLPGNRADLSADSACAKPKDAVEYNQNIHSEKG